MEAEDLDIIVDQPLADPSPPNIVYRALRPDELFTLVSTGFLSAPCSRCPYDVCCNISASAHVNSGSRANMKSRWISTTRSLNIASLWAARKGNAMFTAEHAPGKASGIVAVIGLTSSLEYSDPTKIEEIGVTAKNATIASQEILIKDRIPYKNIIGLYQVEQVNKPEYEEFIGQKVYGKKKKNASSVYVIIHNQIVKTDPSFSEYLKHAADIGLKSRFVSSTTAGTRKSKHRSHHSSTRKKNSHKRKTRRN